ncbi:hypothetical protein SAMN05444169_1366 [Bradyrhizobium erythrophlei]|uniref:Uncharacterized protein n=1 Tax=Bradyrhizobium erythrophlei TaxID=1437360 RepID=A0A1M5I9L6_9BRAD|nr:hypothetical protein SAMN05444169_1366 [Bradyrhizobium erythrophlei]
MAQERLSTSSAVALRGSAPWGAFAHQGDGTSIRGRIYSTARFAALANFFSTRSRFSFDK